MTLGGIFAWMEATFYFQVAEMRIILCECGIEGGMKASMFLMNEDTSELNPL